MIWWLKFVVIWLSFDIVVLATAWYAVNTLKRYFPNWWERVIACEVESDLDLELEIIEIPSFKPEPESAKYNL
jgi:hypothetical protein